MWSTWEDEYGLQSFCHHNSSACYKAHREPLCTCQTRSEVVSLGFTIMFLLGVSLVRKEWLVVLLWIKAKSRYPKDKPGVLKSPVSTVYYSLLILKKQKKSQMIKCNCINSTSLLVIHSKGLSFQVIYYAIRNLPPSVASGLYLLLIKGLW